MPDDSTEKQSKLSAYQINVIVMLGDLSQMSSMKRTDNYPKAATWESLMKKGMVERIPLDELSFNHRCADAEEKWVRLTEEGRKLYLELVAEAKGKEEKISSPF